VWLLPRLQGTSVKIRGVTTEKSPEFPTDQLNRLPGSPYYLESVVTALKKDGLLRTYYRDKLRGYRLGPRAKATLLESRPTGLPAT